MQEKKAIKLADTEWKIMQVLWEDAPLTCRQIEDILKSETGWTRHTIISFLKRMHEKKYIRMEEAKPSRLYYPLLDKNETVLRETQSFIQKLFKGKTGLMISSLADSGGIPEEEIRSIMETLQQIQAAEDAENE